MLKTVSIVGAGPGDPELLTLKAKDRIDKAEAVVHDRLIPQEILNIIPETAQKYFAGKSCKEHFMVQEDINNLLVTLARKGLRVVRLKGGDPTIFGRGGEEAEHLARNGIPFEIMPGISSATGCAAHYHIPLTHRELASSVRYITGHSKEGQLDLDWKSLADLDTTLVIYMGLANITVIAEKLIEHSLPDDMPVAAIEDGTTPQGRIVISTLAKAGEDISTAELKSPTLIIIGRVVALYEKLIPATG